MGKIYCLLGKSSSGKDTIYKKLLGDAALGLCPIVSYTTRPIRDGEQEGVEYHFSDEEGYLSYREAGKIIESRTYQTVYGPWRYFTVDDGSFSPEKGNFLIIGTVESFVSFCQFFGKEQVIPLFIEVDDGVRLQRALDRERTQETPKYEEMCRRFLADAKDFAPEKMKEAGIGKTYKNTDLQECLEELRNVILNTAGDETEGC